MILSMSLRTPLNVPYAFLLVLAALTLPSLASSIQRDLSEQRLEPRFINGTLLDACKDLQPSRKVHYVLSPQFSATLNRYISSTVQTPACLFLPTEANELTKALKVIGQKRVPFAVSSGRHASNKGFSSTNGIQIDMKGFQAIKLSDDKSYVDIGSGNIWDNVYQALEGEFSLGLLKLNAV